MKKEYILAITISLFTAWASQWVQESPESRPAPYLAVPMSPIEAEIRDLRMTLQQARVAQQMMPSSFLDAPKNQ